MSDTLQEALVREAEIAEHEIRTVALVEWGWPSGPRHDALVRWATVLREAADRLRLAADAQKRQAGETDDRVAAITQRLVDSGCFGDDGPCREQCDAFKDYCLACQADWLLHTIAAQAAEIDALRAQVETLWAIVARWQRRAEAAESQVAQLTRERERLRAMLEQTGLSLSIANDPLAISSLLDDSQREREMYHGLIARIRGLRPEWLDVLLLDLPEAIRAALSPETKEPTQ